MEAQPRPCQLCSLWAPMARTGSPEGWLSPVGLWQRKEPCCGGSYSGVWSGFQVLMELWPFLRPPHWLTWLGHEPVQSGWPDLPICLTPASSLSRWAEHVLNGLTPGTTDLQPT